MLSCHINIVLFYSIPFTIDKRTETKEKKTAIHIQTKESSYLKLNAKSCDIY